MGSKRTKKSKQELELLPEKTSIKKNETDANHVTEISASDIENSDLVAAPVRKAPKRKKKPEGEPVPRKLKKIADNTNNVAKNKPKKRNSISNGTTANNPVQEVPINGDTLEKKPETQMKPLKEQKDGTPEKKKDKEKDAENITWPSQDISELIDRIERIIPEADVLSYKSRVDKLNWDIVAFKTYSSDECKKTWILVQKRIRRFRLLSEILHDARSWLNAPKDNHKLPRPKKHPDMPRRPLSSYLLFYLKKKDQVIKENPGLDGSDITKLVGQIFKNLPPEKREKYERLAATNREEYAEKLKVFFETHPEFEAPRNNHKVDKEKPAPAPVPALVPSNPNNSTPPKPEKRRPGRPPGSGTKGRPPKNDPAKEKPPKKNQSPFGLYFASELKNMEEGMEKQVFREKCKQEYKKMPDQKKVIWINLAEQDLIRYQVECKAYKAKYPEFQVNKPRPVISKKEKIAKERAAGKPSKPPNSAYALFSRVMLQSEEIKSVPPKERMNYLANKWKTYNEEEQNKYKDQVLQLMEQYHKDYAAYVESLPEDEKRKIINAQKRKKSKSKSRRSKKSKKRKTPKKVPKPPPPPPKPTKFKEPEQPPISACKYFVSVFKGEGDPIQAWKASSPEDKRKYEEELVKIKQAYIVEFERFLKSLSKEELEAYSKLRQQQVKSDEESSDCSSGSEGDDEDDEDGDDDDDDEEENGEDETVIKEEEDDGDAEDDDEDGGDEDVKVEDHKLENK